MKIIDRDGNNLFHYAARNCYDKQMFHWLYQRRVNVIKRNKYGQTPFLVACLYSNALMIEMFLDLNSSNVLWHAFLEDRDNEGNSGLHYAIQNADLKSFLILSFSHSHSSSFIFFCTLILTLRISVVMLLLKKGHSLDIVNNKGQTPIDLCANKQGRISKLLKIVQRGEVELSQLEHAVSLPEHTERDQQKKECLIS
jgi:ankyrin repeat protein